MYLKRVKLCRLRLSWHCKVSRHYETKWFFSLLGNIFYIKIRYSKIKNLIKFMNAISFKVISCRNLTYHPSKTVCWPIVAIRGNRWEIAGLEIVWLANVWGASNLERIWAVFWSANGWTTVGTLLANPTARATFHGTERLHFVLWANAERQFANN